ncbi:MAG TPA: heavy-metal-associated domain-containing protein [Desulfobacterales bacterium]|nr:heavy-metal-associated domain-containing protein [Desulfobacterales bacterium]
MTTIAINGMSCPHCVASTTKALEEIAGISNVTVDLKKKQANYDGDVEQEIVKDAITKIGFEVIE